MVKHFKHTKMTTTEKVFKTNNYGKFKLYKFNRQINESLVQRIMESIDKIGYIAGKSIIVDKEMNIIDGQHRFEACKRKMLPIFFTIIKGDAQKVIIELNTQQVNWKMNDYLNSWANNGVKVYQDLLAFETQYKLGISNSLHIFFDAEFDKTMTRMIKEGKVFPLNTKSKELAEFIISCNAIAYYKHSHFVRALCKVFHQLNDKQLKKLRDGLISLPQQATTSAYVTAFENIINRSVTSKNRISFNKSK